MRAAIVLGAALSLVLAPAFVRGYAQGRNARSVESLDQGPPLLSFDELVTLSRTAHPEGALGARLDAILQTPFLHREANREVDAPHSLSGNASDAPLRVGLWNIERGMNLDLIKAALTDTRAFEDLAGASEMRQSKREAVESQLAVLQSLDVLVLNEADWGMKRTGYRNVTADLATALHMNSVFGAEFVEVDPIFALGAEEVHLDDPDETRRLQSDLRVDAQRYLGLHGTAVLSRYPIRGARMVRLPVCYDWYGKEVEEAARLEKGKRWTVQRLFGERIDREIRQGGRMALIVDLAVPGVPGGQVTVVATHLENRCAPACRQRQMRALLREIGPIRNPVVLAGDLNTTGQTNTPTSVSNEIMSRVVDYQFWIGQAVSWFHPLGIYQHLLSPVRYFHSYNDPTAYHLPVVWNNREQPLFREVRRFRFADGRSFDFRGEPSRTVNRRGGTLADSNERARKGFVPTYAFARDYGGLVGRFKLDWIFVKPYTENPGQPGPSGILAPAFARTLRELNQAVPNRLSDHPPLTVDLPLSEGVEPEGKRDSAPDPLPTVGSRGEVTSSGAP
ncbi:MAG TPA: endonuclease/exonuclease/phosphatase family protein [Acidobacteriaceae bacterium]|jgi:endonuclease/exonuclease/phosphatase family metal-dependent hydrolase|nr:endonuclease/exonuclease/phosphatase family protein [Acidobacteriaceae bacterium]